MQSRSYLACPLGWWGEQKEDLLGLQIQALGKILPGPSFWPMSAGQRARCPLKQRFKERMSPMFPRHHCMSPLRLPLREGGRGRATVCWALSQGPMSPFLPSSGSRPENVAPAQGHQPMRDQAGILTRSFPEAKWLCPLQAREQENFLLEYSEHALSQLCCGQSCFPHLECKLPKTKPQGHEI